MAEITGYIYPRFTMMTQPDNNHILITGRPGAGKTTAIRAIVEGLDPGHIVGFYCEARLVDGKRAGFVVKMLTGEQGLLAGPEVEGLPRFGSLREDGLPRLGVTFTFLNDVACPEVCRDAGRARLIVIDEIGPMQAVSPVFRDMVTRVLALSGPAVLASIAASDDDEWVATIRRAQKANVIAVDCANRSEVPGVVTQRLVALGVPARRPLR